MLRVSCEMGCMQPLANRAVADGALSAVTLDDLHLEPLLVWAPARLPGSGLSIFEEFERVSVDGIASWNTDWERPELDEEQALIVIPGGNPSLTDDADGALLQDDEYG
jgi:hypothetical protein